MRVLKFRARELKKAPESHFLYMRRRARAAKGTAFYTSLFLWRLGVCRWALFILGRVSAPVLAAAVAALPNAKAPLPLAESRAAHNQPDTPTTAWELARGNLRLEYALINCAKSGGGQTRHG